MFRVIQLIWFNCYSLLFALSTVELSDCHRSPLSSSTVKMSSSTTPRLIHCSPFRAADDEDDSNIAFDKSTTAMIILNSPIRKPPSPLFERLWNKSSFHICADGGANRLYKATRGLSTKATATASTTAASEAAAVAAAVATSTDTLSQSEGSIYLPDLITGDLDSLQAETREYFAQRNVPIVQQYDQDYNDLDKSIRSIPERYRTCFVYGAFGGRFDQEMASVQALFAHLDTTPTPTPTTMRLKIWLYSDQNAAILLQPGPIHCIRLPNYGRKRDENNSSNDSNSGNNNDTNEHEQSISIIPSQMERVLGEGPTCGLIPIGHSCQQVTTTGLQWNLNGQQPLEFGGLVSTSNHVVDQEVTVQCSHPLLFTVEVHAGLDDEELW